MNLTLPRLTRMADVRYLTWRQKKPGLPVQCLTNCHCYRNEATRTGCSESRSLYHFYPSIYRLPAWLPPSSAWCTMSSWFVACTIYVLRFRGNWRMLQAPGAESSQQPPFIFCVNPTHSMFVSLDAVTVTYMYHNQRCTMTNAVA